MKDTFPDDSYDRLMERVLSLSPSFGSCGAGAYKAGLERSLMADSILGFPSRDFPCIHVAGTNGKGSVCNFLAASLAAGGRKVGLYTSPHILDWRERMRTVQDGSYSIVSKQWVRDFLARYLEEFEKLGLSFFELGTAMCFKWFSEVHVDIAVIETGLGGRLDATNIITPRLSVITNIGYDHMDILGDTLEKIASEKAGIIKDGVDVVIGESSPATDGVFRSAASAHGSRIVFADRRPGCIPDLSETDLQGIYEAKNINTAVCALITLGLEPDLEAVSRAAHICGFHARWEKINDNPLTVCDIGHNRHGLEYNFAQLEDMLAEGLVTDLVLVYGSVRDKDVDAVLGILPREGRIFFCSADNPRALEAGELLRRRNEIIAVQGIPDAKVPDAVSCASVAEALEKAQHLCREISSVPGRKPLLYIGGSTYVVSEALSALGVTFPEHGGLQNP